MSSPAQPQASAAPAAATSQPADWVPGQTQPYTRPKTNFKESLASCFNTAYFKTFYFILKAILIILQIGGAVSVSFTYSSYSASQYYDFVAISGIVIILIIIILHVTRVTTRFENVPWSFGEMVFDAIWAILMIIAASIVTDYARKYTNMDSYAAGAFFGWSSVLVYLIDAVIRLLGICRGNHRSSKSQTPAANAP